MEFTAVHEFTWPRALGKLNKNKQAFFNKAIKPF